MFASFFYDPYIKCHCQREFIWWLCDLLAPGNACGFFFLVELLYVRKRKKKNELKTEIK